MAYQIEFSRYHPLRKPRVTTLLSDFECTVVPNTVHATYAGHSADVKCVTFVGEKGQLLASGSSDHSIGLWHTIPQALGLYLSSVGV